MRTRKRHRPAWCLSNHHHDHQIPFSGAGGGGGSGTVTISEKLNHSIHNQTVGSCAPHHQHGVSHFMKCNMNNSKLEDGHKFYCFYKTTTTTTCRKIKHFYLPKILVTFLYLSTWFYIFYFNEKYVHHHNQDTFTPLNFIQLVNGQRLFKTFQQPQIPPNYQTPSTVTLNSKSSLPDIIAQQGGIIKDRNITFKKQYNPIVITKDLVIRKDAKLTIEPGTELLFEQRKGIIVYGTLQILGNQNDKVKLNLLKSQQSATVKFRSHNNNPINQQLVRLVDGDLPSEGRVQIKFNDRWHSLCTNSKNLTAADIKVICQQVGYRDGHWYKWFPKRNDTTFQIMSKSFHCSGGETSLTQCRRWIRVRTGGGVCDYHSDIGIRCSKTLNFGMPDNSTVSFDYWRGIEFINSDVSHEYVLDGQMKQKVSKSNLKHLTISEAGLNQVGNATAAIRVYGQPPEMSDIEIKNSIYGIMIEDTDDAIRLNNIRLINNMGNPLFVNTSWGKVMLDKMHIENNGGDGIRVARHEKIIVGPNDFCKFVNLGSSQTFPVVLSHEQTFFTSGRDCCQEFISNNQLTVHFPVLRSTPNNLLPEANDNRRISIPAGVNIGKDANLVIYDDYRDEFPFRFTVKNGTRAQSIVSRTGRLKICYEPAIYRTVLFTIEVVADSDDDWSGRARDVEISNSFISNNDGRGIWVDNQRSGVKVANTIVMNNNYLSGVHVENGTGEVIIQGSKISNNSGHGVFINLAGGYYHIDNSTISDNSLKGVSLEYDRRPEIVPFNHTFHIGYSLITRNGENGLFIGNVCRSDAFWNISMNSFIKNGEDAIIFQSCLPTQDSIYSFKSLTSRLNLSDSEMLFHNNYQELFITHNIFLANARRAIRAAPVFFVKSFIRHNLFKDHPLAVLYIGNQAFYPGSELDNTTQAPVNIRIASNRFYFNQGRYVANIGLQEDNPKHALVFTKNTLEDNNINEPYSDLRPRSRVSAVVVVSSSNTRVIRNRFNNPQSSFEMGSHLEVHSKVINATTNFWGHGLDASSIYKRIFDRKNRYNLAQVEFLQYLLSPEDLEYASDLSFDRERDKISTFRNGTKLGGEVKGYEELGSDTYIVQDDIFVRPGAHLILKPGTVLKFYDGVGVMVQGRLDAVGQTSSQIVFTSVMPPSRIPQRTVVTTTPNPITNSWVSHQPDGGGHEEESEPMSTYKNLPGVSDRPHSTIIKRQVSATSAQSIRLSQTTMGRLEVQIGGVWGSVCDYNFDIDDAAVACQQLGMILNRDDWLLERFRYASNDQQQISMISNNVLMTNLRCDPTLDVDITRCKAEISLRGDFDGMCNSEVGIRCFPPSWSGVRLGMGAETSTLEHVIIQRAGMFDYATFHLKPALQVDFNRHWISSLVVKSNSDSGLGIMWNDVIGRHFSELSISESKFFNNERHGIELRSRGLSVKNCLISNNRQNGLDYNPSFSMKELNDLLSWLHTTKNSDNIVTLSFPLQSTKYFSVPSAEDSYRVFIFQKNPPTDLKETFTISTDPGHMLSIQLLNPMHFDSTETLNMSLGVNPDSPIWNFRVNMTSMPMTSPGYKFHFNYTTGSRPHGNIVLYIRSRYNNRDLKSLTKYIAPHLVMPKFEQTAANINSKLINSLVITNSNITRNGIGLKFRHPNHSYGPRGSYNQRFANETTNITNNIFDSNHFSCIFVGPDDFHESAGLEEFKNESLPASEITYHVLGNKIRRNKDGIRQFSKDIRQSYNVFHWSINDTIFENNKNGGINLLLPYYWRYDANLSHSIELHNNSFLRNSQFEMVIDGHFLVLNATRNAFKENKCKGGLIALRGMEKKMLIRYNTIEYNTCGRIIELNIQSHADKMGFVPSYFDFNSLRFNRKPSTNATLSTAFRNSKLITKLHPHSVDFTMSLKGVQTINMTRNLFVNPELRFELVVAIIMDPEEKTVNAVENYWGSVLQSEINDRIFDFDDWNSYAIAEISPYLTQDSFTSATIVSDLRKEILHQSSVNRPLGGRLTKSLTLPYRKEPYLIESDLTVMPNVKLTIDKGATLEFMPNVGILVLGEIIAAGTREKPIQMKPALSASDIMPLHQYLYPTRVKPSIIQTNPTDPLSYEHSYTFRHYQFAYPIDMGSLRLCKNEICNDGSHIYENNVEDSTLRQEVLRSSENTWKIDGFLEIFNMTTLQWVPVCDPLFTEHTAKVVCRQLGYSHLSIYKRGRRYTIEQEQIISIKDWAESVQCEGDEANLSSCTTTPLGSNSNHSSACFKDSNQFVYIYCADFPDTAQSTAFQQNHGTTNELIHHWGGIRFSCPSTSTSNNNDARDSYNMISSSTNKVKSRLQYVNIDRAGMLHRKKTPAVQVLQCNIQMDYVSITSSAHHGLEYITSHGNQNFHQLRIRNSLGVGFNYLSLTGSSSANRLVPYLPLKHLDISSEIFGLVDICGANKQIQVEERLLLFYRYNSQSVDCIKIISSKLQIKHIGIRMLQFDLFNSTAYTQRPDSIRIYDGNIFDRDSRLLVDLGVTERHRMERPELKFYQTTDSYMTVRLHVSGASPLYGFIAEIVTTPVSYNIQRDNYNNITFSEITQNKLGALNIATAGESTPNLIIKNNRFELNCLHLFGNFTSCVSPVYMELQNCQKLRIFNNLYKSNQGGVAIKSYSHSAVSALEASLENNVFEGNQNTNTLALLGPKTDPYQSVRVVQNFFTRNVAQYASNIVLSRIVANFSYNILSGNIGKHQIEVLGFDKLPLSYQTFLSNWIYNNTATLERDRSTIVGNSAGQQYRDNYLVNPDNHFEISTLNWSRYDVKPFHPIKDDEIIHLASGDGSSKDVFRKTADAIPLDIVDTKKLDIYQATIDAEQNWWGFNSTGAIQGRIRDRLQHEELLKVDFIPFLETNNTVLSSICAGGWQKVGDACLVFVGSRMTYQEAKDFCDRERASLTLLRGNHYEFTDFVKTQEREFDPKIDRVWVRSFEVSRDACPTLSDYRTKNYDCQDKYPFLCEKDPQIVISLLHWHRDPGGLVALILALITLILTFCCTLCWGYKSRQMHKEKLERRKNSLYASMRSNRGPYSSNNSISEQFLHRQLYNTENSSIHTDLSLSTQFTQPSVTNDNPNQLVHFDPAYNPPKAQPRINGTVPAYSPSYYRPLFESQLPTNSAHESPTPFREQFRKRTPTPTVNLNPDYVSPLLEEEKDDEDEDMLPQQMQQTAPQPEHRTKFSPKPITPAPSYREAHPKALSSNGSRTPSYAGSQNNEVFMDPMPFHAPAYSQIDHLASNVKTGGFTSPTFYNFRQEQYQDQANVPPSYNNNQIRDIDDSESTAPTYYSNQIENYEDSTESYIEAYNKALQRLNNDQVSFVITEHSTTTEDISLTRTSIIDSQTDLVSMKPQGPLDSGLTEASGVAHSNKAFSEANSGSQHRYLVETSFDEVDEAPTMEVPTSVYGSSQRLSPVSSSYALPDSKLGSRVYLETSFE